MTISDAPFHYQPTDWSGLVQVLRKECAKHRLEKRRLARENTDLKAEIVRLRAKKAEDR